MESSKKHIVIIDDDPIYQRIIKFLAQRMVPDYEQHALLNAAGASQILKKLLKRGEQVYVLLDLNMPEYDGWRFLDLTEKASWAACSQLKLFVVSSTTDTREIERAKEYALVKDVITKPFTKENLNYILGYAS
ncbi:response regulator [Mesonia sediminis]|uniref:Response regulator n=1 Tax=Mesonia sediminis TaxID=1703946 RepID=A0ABW5S9W5_9FLAO